MQLNSAIILRRKEVASRRLLRHAMCSQERGTPASGPITVSTNCQEKAYSLGLPFPHLLNEDSTTLPRSQ